MIARRDDYLRQARSILTGLLILGGLYAVYLARDFLIPVTFGFFIAMTFRPIIRASTPRGLSPWLATSLVVSLLLLLAALTIYAFSGAIAQWIAEAPDIQRTLVRKLGAILSSFSGFVQFTESLQDVTAPASDPLVQQVVVKQPLAPLILSLIAAYPANLVIVVGGALVIAVFLMASGDFFYSKLIKVLPTFSDKKNALRIVWDVEHEVSSYFLTVAAINAALGAAIGVVFWLLGLPTAHLWALFAFILNFIPYLGPITGVILSGLAGIVVFDDFFQALLAPAAYAALIGVETQLVTPAILSRRMRINSVAILLALAFWAWAWGIAGVAMAVPILVTFRALCSHIAPLAPVGEFLAAPGPEPHAGPDVSEGIGGPTMPAKSKAQQKAAGAALAAKRGEIPVSKLRGASKEMYESMTEAQLEEFAESRRKGLPEHASQD